MKLHTVIGANIMAPIRQMKRLLPGLRSHHERWTGGGVPGQAQGERHPADGAHHRGGRHLRRDDDRAAYQKAVSFERRSRASTKLKGSGFDEHIVGGVQPRLPRRRVHATATSTAAEPRRAGLGAGDGLTRVALHSIANRSAGRARRIADGSVRRRGRSGCASSIGASAPKFRLRIPEPRRGASALQGRNRGGLVEEARGRRASPNPAAVAAHRRILEGAGHPVAADAACGRPGRRGSRLAEVPRVEGGIREVTARPAEPLLRAGLSPMAVSTAARSPEEDRHVRAAPRTLGWPPSSRSPPGGGRPAV